MDLILTIIALVFIFGLLVFVHEFGHFLAAKLSGIVVEEFALGFGKNVWQRTFKGTVYKLNMFPLGGYVKLEGEDPGEEADPGPHLFHNQPFRIKFGVFVAGVVMNMILAVLLFAVYLSFVNYKTEMVNVSDFRFLGAAKVESIFPVRIAEIKPDGAAAKSELHVDDRMIEIAGQRFASIEEFRSMLEKYAGQETKIGVYNLDEHTTKQVTVKLSNNKESLLGVSISPPQYQFYVIDYPNNIISAFAHTYNVTAYQFPALFKLISRSIQESNPSYAAQSVGGVVSVSAVVNELVIAKQFIQLVNLTALISVSLATVNILPIPILDGGQILLALIEKIKGSKLSHKVIENINMVSFAFIIILFLSITLKDLWQFDIFNQIGDFVRKVLSL